MKAERSLGEARDAGVRLLTICLWVSTLTLAVIGWGIESGDTWLATGLSALLNVTPTWCRLKGRSDGEARMSFGVAAALHPALYVYLLQGHAWQMDMHMYFFAALAALTVLYDRRALIAAAVIIVFHHLALQLAAPGWAFVGGASIGRVLLHAGIVLLQTAALSMLTSRLVGLISAHENARHLSEELAVAAAASEERARAALAERDVDYRLLAENSNDLIVRMNLQGVRLYVSPASLPLLGYTPEELLGAAAAGEIHADDRPGVIATCHTLLEGAENPICTYRQRHKRGHYVWLEASYRLIRDPNTAEPIEFIATVRDIGRRQRAELERSAAMAELQENHRLLLMAEQMGGVGHWRLDLASETVTWSDVVCAIHGVEKGYVPPLKDAINVYHPDDRALVQQKVEAALSTGIEYGFSARVIQPDGATRHVVSRGRPEIGPDGSVMGLVGVFQDVTDAHDAEVALREAGRHLADNNRMLTMAETVARVGHWRVDNLEDRSFWSDEAYRIRGLPRDYQPTFESVLAAYHPDDRERVREIAATAMATGTAYQFKARLFRPDGIMVHVSLRGEVDCAADGSVRGLFGTIQDVSEQAEAELLLQQREAQFRLITEQASDIIVRLDLDDRCLYASPAIREVTGFGPEEVVGVDLIGASHRDERDEMRARNAALRAGRIDRLEYQFRTRHRDGHWVWLEAHSSLVRDRDGAPVEVVSVVRNVSDRKVLEEQLVEARERAEAAAHSKANFLADMSHEIRTPMNGVVGFTDLLLAGDLSPDQRRRAELIADSGRSMVRLLNDILDLSKIDAGHMTVATEPYNLSHALSACAKLVRPAIEQKGVELRCDLSDALPKAVMGDGLRVRQIVLNLLGNAAKFTHEGSITLRARINRQAGGAVLSISVEDTGIGIAPDRQEAIFEEFVQADASTGPRFGGTGLGLSISARLARLMGGELRLESEPGRGSCFILILPLTPAVEQSLEVTKPVEADVSQPDLGRAAHVLVAEDHDINQLLITAMLDRLGCRHALATDGREAVDMVAAAAAAGDPYSLVLMDMQMPEVDGLEATRRIRSAGVGAEALPIVALTANAYADDVTACLDAGMQAHLGKPVTLTDLTAALRRWTGEPPANATATRFSPSLHARYQQRKEDTLTRLDTLVSGGDYGDAAVAAAAELLHKLAGTAAMFGEAEVGERARVLEYELLNRPEAERAEKTAAALAQLKCAA